MSDQEHRDKAERERIELYRRLLEYHKDGLRIVTIEGRAIQSAYDNQHTVQVMLEDILSPLLPSIEHDLVERMAEIVAEYDARMVL